MTGTSVDTRPVARWLGLDGGGRAGRRAGIVLALGGFGASDPMRALIYGAAIVGAAFLLSWAAEAVQFDFSQGLALAMLALIAILPEYVVDASFAWLAAEDPAYAGLRHREHDRGRTGC